MVEKEIFIDTSDGQYLVAVREEGKLVDFFFDLLGNYIHNTIELNETSRQQHVPSAIVISF